MCSAKGHWCSCLPGARGTAEPAGERRLQLQPVVQPAKGATPCAGALVRAQVDEEGLNQLANRRRNN